MTLPDFHITGAITHGPAGPTDQPLHIADGLISDQPSGRAVRLEGWTLRPGMIDVHGDGFERHLAPRRGALKDLSQGFGSLDTELAANGITTAYLAQFYSWEGGMRGPDFAERMLDALATARRHAVTDLKVQLRVEMSLIDHYDQIAALIDHHRIPYVVFNDHIPHDALDKGKRPPRLTGQALKSGRSPEAHLELLQTLHDRRDQVPEALTTLANRLTSRGILTGSHDDPDTETRQKARAMGLAVSEFPETRAAAQEAAAHQNPVVMGAPNVVRGGSHQNKVAATDLIRDGLCTALASDYHYPALFQAVTTLGPEVGEDAAWALVTTGPAQMLGLIDRGRLTPGLRADLIAINPETGRIGLTVTGGRIAYADPQAAQALLTA